MAASKGIGSVNEAILRYLEDNGHTKIAEMLRAEETSKRTTTTMMTAGSSSSSSSGSGGGAAGAGVGVTNTGEELEAAYSALHQWIVSSLDVIKGELIPISFAVFVAVFIDLIARGLPERANMFRVRHMQDHLAFHMEDITALAQTTQEEQLNDNSCYAAKVRNQKFNIVLSKLAQETFFEFLFDEPVFVLLSLVNRYINIQVSEDKPEPGPTFSKKEDMAREASASANIDAGMSVDAFNNEKKLESLRVPEGFEQLWFAMGNDINFFQNGTAAAQATPFWNNYRDAVIKPLRQQRSAFGGGTHLTSGPTGSGPSIAFLTFDNSGKHRDTLCGLDVSWNSSIVAGGYTDSRVRVWHEADFGQNSYELVAHSGPVYATSISPDNKFILSASEDGTTRLWMDNEYQSTNGPVSNVNNRWHNKVVYSKRDSSPSMPVWDVKFAPFGRLFATASHDRTACVWVTDRNEAPIRMFVGHYSDVDCVAWHPSCRYLATGSSDKTARLFDLDSGQCVRVFAGGHSKGLTCAAINPKGDLLATASLDNSVTVWDIATGKRMSLLQGHEKPVFSLAWDPDSKYLLSGGADCSVRMWNAPDQSQMQKKQDNGLTEPKSIFFTRHTCVTFLRFLNRDVCVGAGGFSL